MIQEVLYDRGYIVNYTEGDSAVYRTPIQYFISPNDIFHTISSGETLFDIARKYYGISSLWFMIADVNDSIKEDIFTLEIGSTILVPNIESIQLNYG